MSATAQVGLKEIGGQQEVQYRYLLKDKDGKVTELPENTKLDVTSSDPAAIAVAPDATPIIHNPGQPDDGQPDKSSTATGVLKGQGKVVEGVSITWSLKDPNDLRIVPDVVEKLDSAEQGPISAEVEMKPVPPASK